MSDVTLFDTQRTSSSCKENFCFSQFPQEERCQNFQDLEKESIAFMMEKKTTIKKTTGNSNSIQRYCLIRRAKCLWLITFLSSVIGDQRKEFDTAFPLIYYQSMAAHNHHLLSGCSAVCMCYIFKLTNKLKAFWLVVLQF